MTDRKKKNAKIIFDRDIWRSVAWFGRSQTTLAFPGKSNIKLKMNVEY